MSSSTIAPSPAQLRRRFQSALNSAITQGQTQPEERVFGTRTREALARLAHAHPYASTDSILAAWEAFHQECPTSDLTDVASALARRPSRV